MADAADSRFEVVLVYHTSRFARNQVEAKRYKQLLRERLDIRVVSVTQPMGEDPSDPSSFLAESIHEMFDEYYSVSLSFWIRAAMREKARQGHLLGRLPWGYMRSPDSRLAVHDPERAPLVRESFERYATGEESDRTIAAWLNAKGARTTYGRAFSKDTVREMLVNAAYCGYVNGLRSKDRSIRGLHEPIVSEELFDRVQEVRSWRLRVLKPGRPSEDYLLRKLLYCDLCGARMHGTKGGGKHIRRYQCSTRRYSGDCSQAITRAEPLEAQLVDWIRDFQPSPRLRELMRAAVREHADHGTGDRERRRALGGQLDRLKDLFVLGDLTKDDYVIRKRALEQELERLDPPTDPQLDRAEAMLADFSRFWESEPSPAERRKLVAGLFERVWQDGGEIVAVKPRAAFLPYFQTAGHRPPKQGDRSGSDGTRTRDLRRDRPAL
jgi:site-specific DNA recombinase